MKKTGLIIISAATLLACASEPPLPPSAPAPAPAEQATPAPALAPDPPAQTADGPWRASLISVRTVEKAARLSRLFADKGYRVETEEVEVEGTTWQRLVFPGQNSREEAQEVLAKLEQEFGIQGGWVPPPR